MKYLTSFDYSSKFSHLNEAMSVQTENDRTHLALLRQQSADLSAINDDMKNIKDASLPIQRQLRETLGPLIQKMDQIPEMTATQSDNICVLLESIQNQVSGLSTKISQQDRISIPEPRNSQIPYQEESEDGSEKDDKLLESIGRLCQLAKEKEGTASGTGAESIIDDLDALLESVTKELSHRDPKSCASRKRTIDMVQTQSSLDSREMKRIRVCLLLLTLL